MLIKLNQTSFVTTGHGASKKVESTNTSLLWLNPAHIIAIDVAKGSEQYPQHTRVFLTPELVKTATIGNSSVITVLESPEQINALINAAIRGAR